MCQLKLEEGKTAPHVESRPAMEDLLWHVFVFLFRFASVFASVSVFGGEKDSRAESRPAVKDLLCHPPPPAPELQWSCRTVVVVVGSSSTGSTTTSRQHGGRRAGRLVPSLLLVPVGSPLPLLSPSHSFEPVIPSRMVMCQPLLSTCSESSDLFGRMVVLLPTAGSPLVI